MARAGSTRLNIRSRFAHERATTLARETGLTTTQVIEEALRAFLPPSASEVNARLIRKGAILVKPASRLHISLAESEARLREVRGDRG